MGETLWRSPSGMMHKSASFTGVTYCGRNFKNRLSLKPLMWRRALLSEETDNSIPRCSHCERSTRGWISSLTRTSLE